MRLESAPLCLGELGMSFVVSRGGRGKTSACGALSESKQRKGIVQSFSRMDVAFDWSHLSEINLGKSVIYSLERSGNGIDNRTP